MSKYKYDAAYKEAQSTIDAVSEQILEEPEALAMWLEIQAKLSGYSAFNTMLIAAQFPQASKLADKEAWNQRGTTVNQDATPIDIMTPVFNQGDQSKPVSYTIKQVYDISQTSEQFDPELHEAKGYNVLTKALEEMKTVPYQITDKPLLVEYRENDNAILVNPSNKHSNRAFFNSLVYAVSMSLIKEKSPGKADENKSNPKRDFVIEMWNDKDVARFNCECIAYMMDSRYLKPDNFYDKQIPYPPEAYSNADKWQVRTLFDNMRKLYTEFTEAVAAVEAGVPVRTNTDKQNSSSKLGRRIKTAQETSL